MGEADADQLVGILPLVPENAGPQRVGGNGRPGGFGGGIIRQVGADEVPGVVAKDFTQPLAGGVSGEGFGTGSLTRLLAPSYRCGHGGFSLLKKSNGYCPEREPVLP